MGRIMSAAYVAVDKPGTRYLASEQTACGAVSQGATYPGGCAYMLGVAPGVSETVEGTGFDDCQPAY